MPVIRCKSACKYRDDGGCCTQKEVCFGKNGECWTRGYQPWGRVQDCPACPSVVTTVVCGAKCQNRDALGHCIREDVSFGKYGLCYERGDMDWDDMLYKYGESLCVTPFLTIFKHTLQPGDMLYNKPIRDRIHHDKVKK